jgi:hypothetical protein
MTVSDVPVETWAPVPGASGYVVSDQAHHAYGVRSFKLDPSGRDLTAKKTGTSRYWQQKITYDDGKQRTVPVHTLVLLAHTGPCPPGMEACHYDDDPDNNRLPNLRWDFPPGNMGDRMRNNPAAPKPVRVCVMCGKEIATGRSGRRCEPCRKALGREAADRLRQGERLSKVAEALDYPSLDGVHELARKYGGYGQPRPGLLRRIKNRLGDA